MCSKIPSLINHISSLYPLAFFLLASVARIFIYPVYLAILSKISSFAYLIAFLSSILLIFTLIFIIFLLLSALD